MLIRLGWTVPVMFALLVSGSPSGGAEDSTESSKPLEGLWPSEKLVKSLLARWANEMGDNYELDEERKDQFRKKIVTRWSAFLKEHRSEIQPLANEFIEMRMELQPPAKEDVQAWAERATPVFDLFREHLEQGFQEIREVFNPLQQAKFEQEILGMATGIQLAQKKLAQWREGDFQPHEFWQPTKSEYRRRRAEREQIEREAKHEDLPVDEITKELHSWDKYVEEFVQTYKLDSGQRNTASSLLAEMKGRALAHRDRYRNEIERLERHIEDNSGTDEELAEIKKKLVELYGPIDELFEELKKRLQQVSTSEQRAVVAERDRDQDKKSKETIIETSPP